MNVNSPPETLRLFVACDLPAKVTAAVKVWQTDRLSGHCELRPTAAIHLTLCFLGSVNAQKVPLALSALTAVSFSRIDVSLSEPLFLPRGDRKRVLALRVADPSGELIALQSRVSQALAGAGLYAPEARPFLPHVTVARFHPFGHPFALQNVNTGTFCLSRFILYTSVLNTNGAVHTALATFPAT